MDNTTSKMVKDLINGKNRAYDDRETLMAVVHGINCTNGYHVVWDEDGVEARVRTSVGDRVSVLRPSARFKKKLQSGV